MPDSTVKPAESPLEEPAAEPSLDVLWGEQLDVKDAAIDFFIRCEREAMRLYAARVEGRQK